MSTEVKAIGLKSLLQVGIGFFGTGFIADNFHKAGKVPDFKHKLKISQTERAGFGQSAC